MVFRSISPKIVETPPLRMFEPTTFGSLDEIVVSIGHTCDSCWFVMSFSPELFAAETSAAMFLNTAVSFVMEKLFAFQDVRSALPPSTGGVTEAMVGQSQHQPARAMSGGLSLRRVL